MKPINLLLCGNDKVFDGMLIVILSLVKHTLQPLHIYVMTMDLSLIDDRHQPITKQQIEFLENILKESNPLNKISLFDMTDEFKNTMGNTVNMKNFYTPYCMLRLLADLAPLPDKILYLDTDVVIMKDIKPLYDINITGYEFAGAIDYLGKIFKNIHYINSGVMLLNLEKIRETGLFEKTRQYCTTKKMAFPDQDALNRLAFRKLKVPSCYNSQRMLHKNTVIRHFCKSLRIFPYIHTVNVKPWEVQRLHKVMKVKYLDDLLKEYQIRIEQFKRGDLENDRKLIG